MPSLRRRSRAEASQGVAAEQRDVGHADDQPPGVSLVPVPGRVDRSRRCRWRFFLANRLFRGDALPSASACPSALCQGGGRSRVGSRLFAPGREARAASATSSRSACILLRRALAWASATAEAWHQLQPSPLFLSSMACFRRDRSCLLRRSGREHLRRPCRATRGGADRSIALLAPQTISARAR